MQRLRRAHLSQRQQMAVACRTLAMQGYDDKLAGHLSVRDRDDGTILVPRVGLFWDEITPNDFVRIDGDGTIVEGDGDAQPDDRVPPRAAQGAPGHSLRAAQPPALRHRVGVRVRAAAALRPDRRERRRQGSRVRRVRRRGADHGRGRGTGARVRRRRHGDPHRPRHARHRVERRARVACGRCASSTGRARPTRCRRSACPASRCSPSSRRRRRRLPTCTPTCSWPSTRNACSTATRSHWSTTSAAVTV